MYSLLYDKEEQKMISTVRSVIFANLLINCTQNASTLMPCSSAEKRNWHPMSSCGGFCLILWVSEKLRRSTL